MSIAQRLYEGVETPDGHVGLITYMRTDSTAIAGVAMGEAREVIGERYGDAVHDAQGPRLQDEVEGRPGGARVDPADALPARPGLAGRHAQARGAAPVPPDLAARARLADGAQGARDDDGRAGRRPLRAARERDEDAVRRLRPASTPRAATTTPTRTTRRPARCPPLAEGDVTTVRDVTPDPALHRAAAALHRGDADQGARGARHRPAVDLRRDDLDDRRPRLRPGRGAPAAPGARRRASSPTSSSSTSATTSTSSSRPGWRRSSTRSPAASARGCRCCAPSTARCATASTRSAASCSRRDFTTEATDEVCSEGHPMVIRLGRNGRFLACSLYPEHKETRPLPGEEPPPQEGTGEVCPKCGEGTLVGKRGRFGPFVGCSRYPDCDYIKKDGPPPPDPLPFEVICPKNNDGHLVPRRARRTGNVFWGCSQLPEVRLHDERRAARRRCTTPTTGRWRARARRRICLDVRLDERRAARRRSCPGERYAGRPAEPGGARAPGARPAAAAAAAGRESGGRGARSRPRRPRVDRPTDATRPSRPRTRERGLGRDPRPTRPSTRFLRLLAARDASPHTHRAYATAVGAYLDWLGRARRRLATPGRGPTCAPTSPCSARAGARSTVAQRLAAIRSFHRWAARDGLAPGDPWGAIATPRLPRRLPRVLEVDAGRAAAGRRSTRARGRRRGRRSGAAPARWPSRCATGRWSRRPTPPACASASWRPPTSARSTCGAARSACSARAARSGSGCSGGRPARRSTPTSTTAGRCCSPSAAPRAATSRRRPQVFLNHHGAPLGVRGLRYRLDRLCRAAGLPGGRLAAHAAPLVRDAPARRRRRPARRPGAARPREPGHDPDLHPRLAGAPARPPIARRIRGRVATRRRVTAGPRTPGPRRA